MPYYKKEGTDIHNLSVVPTLKNTFMKEIIKNFDSMLKFHIRQADDPNIVTFFRSKS